MAANNPVRPFSSESVLSHFNSSDNLEELTLVWLDESIRMEDSYCSKIATSFRETINYLKTFSGIEECANYVLTVTTEKVFLITSGKLSETIARLIHNIPQVFCIYVFCENQGKYVEWASNYSKIRGVFVDADSLLIKLREDVKLSYLIISSTISTCLVNNDNEKTSIHDASNDENGTFRFYQLLVEILVYLPHTEDEKDELIQECRKYYHDNKVELNKIDEFDRTYTPDTALLWYTKECFLYRLMNKALRTGKMEVILKFRFFIIDLYKQLLEFYEKDRYLYICHRSSFLRKYKYVQTISENESEERHEYSVFRGQQMTSDELHLFKQRIGSKVLFKAFLSTTTSPVIALIYGTNKLDNCPTESILFEVKINCSEESNPYFDTRTISKFKDENEHSQFTLLPRTLDSKASLDYGR
ncbi:unnamed protein product [Didymodactylos carnosus]|uniref:Uncharacterized protein n=1 Tax=Didymodactylos carnosus TaxID=1234261 RepID=A0A815QM23_9BILA|nr:unnamed protein product [Didymodactylos carnosus]CAF1465758.1 unnamed protein product [Didymodactylos carnosus]CAF3542215.1 unnamed protein product [Didymodactylos carnosus]CAF4334963.1 unnamed protein product [Didymodactylos carnosus]